ncbi:MAG: hypothetical protein GX754_01400 [Clostridiaceae bacterium]|nr:hypothetical protein [Clostridiaceae bacterium]
MIKTNIYAFRCPHCGTKITWIKKLFIDPRYKSKCKKCKGIITLPKITITLTVIWMSILAIIVFMLKKYTVAVYVLGGTSIVISTITISGSTCPSLKISRS